MKKWIAGTLALLFLLAAGCTPKYPITHVEDSTTPTSQTDDVTVPTTEPCSAPVSYTPEITDAKPVIYLYPEKPQQVTVKLDFQGQLTCTYPAYQDGWTVTAEPDGTLRDAAGKQYNYLYWEGISEKNFDFSKGFCIEGKEVAVFLEDALTSLGLNRREANEFIVYWLPQMECNPYNLIYFQQEAHTETAPLEISPEPDTLLRVFMAWQPSREYIKLEPQELTAPERTGFTVVEWGGCRRPEEPYYDHHFCYSREPEQAVPLSAYEQQHITDLLTDATWTVDHGNCENDYVFYFRSRKIRYHSQCGTFHDVLYERSLTLSQEQRTEINNLLCASEDPYAKKYKVELGEHSSISTYLKPAYAPGTQITVHVPFITDNIALAYINGVKQDLHWGEGAYDYWYFTFTMPCEDVLIETKYEGIFW